MNALTKTLQLLLVLQERRGKEIRTMPGLERFASRTHRALQAFDRPVKLLYLFAKTRPPALCDGCHTTPVHRFQLSRKRSRPADGLKWGIFFSPFNLWLL